MAQRKQLKIVQLGLGKVGRALVQHHLDRGADGRFQWIGLGDRSGVWVIPGGWPAEALAEAVRFKSMGMPLTRWHPEAFGAEAVPGSEAYSPELLWRLDELSLRQAVVVDMTSPIGRTTPLLKSMRRGGYDLLLASTRPLSGPLDDYRELTGPGKGSLNYDVVVGGHLPVVRLLKSLIAGGDRITSVEAVPSGTLNLITQLLYEGWAFSAAVGEAAARGLSETDPREDLSGRDVARRMLLLARAMGMELELAQLHIQNLLPQGWDQMPLPQFWPRIGELDHGFGTWALEAKERGHMLRYAARISPPATLELRMIEVPTAGLAGGGCGSSDLYLIYTERNGGQPIVLRGPSSGPQVTAVAVYASLAGMLTDC